MQRKITGYLSESDFAKLVDMTVWGLRAWRRRGYGPSAVKFGRAVFYDRDEAERFLANPQNQKAGDA
ncbi:MAG: helix-turn-helix transcriptional regulator [Brevundimonas aurantiaca]|uniref:helix-turn-helix transcriptional regulator n=1 Tax=Brevundimonas aurantiaca TaxID=74316 RepID=UPI00391BEBA1